MTCEVTRRTAGSCDIKGRLGSEPKNEGTVSLVTSRYPGTNSDVVVVVMAAPPGTAGSRSAGTTRIIDPQSVVGTTELALPIGSRRAGPSRQCATERHIPSALIAV